METPWVEKYRPKKLSDVVHQEAVVASLSNVLKTGNLPHLLFYGPAGTGKTSTILALTRQLFGPDLQKSRVLELNASDERGINVIRQKVKKFAQQSVADPIRKDPRHLCPRYKVVILDEADSMTNEAQAALRRTMETYSTVTRFCIICNYVSRIISPITSRAAVFRFSSIPIDCFSKRVHDVCASEENIDPLDTESMHFLWHLSGGDLRRALTLVQSASVMSTDGKVGKDVLGEVAGWVPEERVKMWIETCAAGSFDEMQLCVESLVRDGFGARGILRQLHDLALSGDGFPKNDLIVSQVLMRIAERERTVSDGADELLQMIELGAFIQRTLRGH